MHYVCVYVYTNYIARCVIVHFIIKAIRFKTHILLCHYRHRLTKKKTETIKEFNKKDCIFFLIINFPLHI